MAARTKVCSQCGKRKPLDAFNRRQDGGKHGRRADCRECKKARDQRYRELNRDAIDEYFHHYDRKRRDKRSANETLRRARERKAIPAGECIDTLHYADTGLRTGFRCHWCGAPADCIDHADALANGGEHAVHNLLPCCMDCNTRKNATDYDEYARKIGGTWAEPFSAAERRSIPAMNDPQLPPCPVCGAPRDPDAVCDECGDGDE